MSYKLVYRSSDYARIPKTTQCRDCEFENIVQTIVTNYERAIVYQREKISNLFNDIYGRKIKIPEKKVSDLYIKITNMEKASGKPVVKMCEDIQHYLGQQTKFVNTDNSPVFLKRIENAYNNLSKNYTRTEIKKLLFK